MKQSEIRLQGVDQWTVHVAPERAARLRPGDRMAVVGRGSRAVSAVTVGEVIENGDEVVVMEALKIVTTRMRVVASG